MDLIPPTGAVNLNRMSNLLDFEVWNTNDEQIGSVNTIVINQNTSQIEYVIVGSGGFLGLGETEIPVPWQAIQLQGLTTDLENVETDAEVDSDVEAVEDHPNVFILNLTEEQIEQMPEFDLTALYDPQEIDPAADADAVTLEELEQEIHTFWADELSRTGTGEPAEDAMEAGDVNNLILADQLLGATIRGTEVIVVEEQPASDGLDDATVTNELQSLGLVDEIMVDTGTGKVTYLLVSLQVPFSGVQEAPAGGVEQPELGTVQEPVTGDLQQAGIELVPVPLTAVEWNAEEEVLVYTGSQALEQAPIVIIDDIDSGDFSWMADADNFWGMVDSDTESK